MAIFNEDTRKQLAELLGSLKNKVQIAFVGSEKDCPTCRDTYRFMEEFSALHDKLSLKYYEWQLDAESISKLGVDKMPGIVLLDENGKEQGVRFYGIPAGYEIHSLISAVREISGIPAEMPNDITERISRIIEPFHIQVFVTPTCSQCPGAAITAHRLALHNEFISADIIEANTFSELSEKYDVKSVPNVIINEKPAFTGSHPVTKFLEIMEQFQSKPL
ncbi:MAG TPA: glutaredoxin [Saprospirales bacterium]|nr:glutaredoxin [Saprospirales bacterium]HAY70267.1 glutaredoxin [Saprospirales bacterium]HRQ29123.1 thioredoxin family protein [Saprospiraceae bacterium]